MDIRTCRILSLCSGVGGIELGLKLAMPNCRTVAYVEIEAYACEILVKRMEEAILDQAPIWTDVKSFDGKPWCGKVDLITGGYPCQPFSIAGKKLGDKDPRHLWPYVRRIVSDINPTMCFFENVGGHLQLGFEQVHDDLQNLGYKVKTGLFTAEEVGAPHKRERLFILAYRDNCGCDSSGNDHTKRHLCPNEEWNITEIFEDGTQLQSGLGSNCQTVADSCCLCCKRSIKERTCEWKRKRQIASRSSSLGATGEMAHSESSGTGKHFSQLWDGAERDSDKLADDNFAGFQKKRSQLQTEGIGGESRQLANSECVRCRRRSDGMETRESCQTQTSGSCCTHRQLPIWPPKPNDYEGWRDIPENIKPAIYRMADGMANRVDRVRACGNGVVPLVAAYAFRTLTANLIFTKGKE